MDSLNAQLANYQFTFNELLTPQGIERLDALFIKTLNSDQHEKLQAYRAGDLHATTEVSELLLELAPVLETFITNLFGITSELAQSQQAWRENDPILAFKDRIIQRGAKRYRQEISVTFSELSLWLLQQINADSQLELNSLTAELRISQWALTQEMPPEALLQWASLALNSEEGQQSVSRWISFRTPAKIDSAHLVPFQQQEDGRLQIEQPIHFRRRDGFHLSDPRMSLPEVAAEVDYCKYCHGHQGDFCSIGFPEKKGDPSQGFKRDAFDQLLTGCPLAEKISEMQVLRKNGHVLAALAMAMVENPMVPATGHRICNDCMKSCIYQKQSPVDIPQVETSTLTTVLNLPWGVEIYDLLSRWNPLKATHYRLQPFNGRRVLVVGMGPAGFTMAHYLTLEGCAVVGVDGLKIEPLPSEWLTQPIRDWSQLEESLDERILLGFGGVAEYGITVRWDKNFLKLIYLSLLRRPTFQVFGGVRLGGTITLEDAWQLGFDHVALATGAGLPRVIPMENSLARGMRQASDFLMALQLTGAGKKSSLASLQVRLPAVVIGGGLTAVDAATEVQAYYIKQVEKTLHRYELLVEKFGEDKIIQGMMPEDQLILQEFLTHGRAVRQERQRAAATNEAPQWIPLLRRWGGVTLAYRKQMNRSPAYMGNHDELTKAFEEGIFYAENLEPIKLELDTNAASTALLCRDPEGKEHLLPARTVLVAAGSSPNTIYESEYPQTFEIQGNSFAAYAWQDGALKAIEPHQHVKDEQIAPFTSHAHQQHLVSFLGDCHPLFNGNVVKAIASSKRTFPEILQAMQALPLEEVDYAAFRAQMTHLLTARVAQIIQQTPVMTEVWIRAPLAAKNFQPGQFFRLQTYESTCQRVAGTMLQIPSITVSGTGVKEDCIRLLIMQWGAGPRLMNRLKPEDPLILMGPTGAPTDMPTGKNIMVIAGRWGAAVMLDIGHALRSAGNRVICIGAYDRATDVDHREELEAGADQMIWCVQRGEEIVPSRPQDISLTANDMVDLVARYGRGELGEPLVALEQVDRLMLMGGTGLLKGFQQALSEGGALYGLIREDVQASGTVGSPMQCMLKGVCGQCLQWQVDPITKQRTKAVFACAAQDQPLAEIDLDNLAARTSQNRLADRINALWLDYLFALEKEGE